MRIVGIEEHVNRPSVMEQMTYLPDALRAKLLPSVEQRIADMDAAGISVQVLSAPITAPGPDGAANPLAPVMPLDESAVPMTQAVNEELYQMVCAHPARFSAFATLPLGVPEAAAAELGRAVKELGFVGTMICGTIGDRFLDDPGFTPILEAAAAMFGDDRVVFSVDYPFEDNRQAREWFNRLDLPGAVREKMAHGTAIGCSASPYPATRRN